MLASFSLLTKVKPFTKNTQFLNILHNAKIITSSRLFKSLHTDTLTDKINNPSLNEHEELRKKAIKVKLASSLRARCVWTQEEDAKLLYLIETLGTRWTAVSKHFVDRSPSSILNRYKLIKEHTNEQWSKEELDVLKKLCNQRPYDEIDNWEEIQSKLPKKRDLYLVKQKYRCSLNPAIKHGRWTELETQQLQDLVFRLGEGNMQQIADLIGTRTKTQCLEKYRWVLQVTKKGVYTPDEDARILTAVKKYGENFAVVCKVAGIQRTPRHVSQHYRNVLDPNIDRSPWDEQEEEKVYETCKKCDKDMVKTKKMLGSRRSIRDMWNHFHKVRKIKEKGPLYINTDDITNNADVKEE